MPERNRERIDIVGWVGNTEPLNAAAGVQTNRGCVEVDAELRTTASHMFAAGYVTGRLIVVHEPRGEAYLAATNAVLGHTAAVSVEVSPLGSFIHPEYASVGLAETAARESHQVIVATQRSTRSLDR